MSNIESYFEKLILNINPDDGAIKNASKAHNDLRYHLSESADYKDFYESSFLYGSYRRSTAIYNIDDVDICILVDIDHTSEE